MNTTTIDIVSYPDGRLDVENAARYLGVSEKTLATWRSKGKGPVYVKLGRVFYYLEDLQQWLGRNGKLQSTSQERALELQQSIHLVKTNK